MSRTLRAVSAFAAAATLLASVAVAQQPPPALEFAKKPAQWIFTAADRKDWKAVKTDDQAREFIDLFWARRDPTPGTPLNEFRREFESLVRYADQNFKEGNRPGSLTERGRVLVTLGFPTNLTNELTKRSAQYNSSGSSLDPLDPTGGRANAARDTWIWEHADASRFDMPKIEVVFVYDMTGNRARRDPQRTDFSSALPRALKKYVVSPELTSVPEWARTGIRGTRAGAVEPAEPQTVPVVEQTVVTNRVVVPDAPVVARPAGAGRLTLVSDAFSIEPQSGADPFASLRSLVSFQREQELGWAAEYCTGVATAELEAVHVGLKISGMVNGEKINMNAPAEEMQPDSIKSSPGCYLVRGAIPLAEVDPGQYQLTVSLAGGGGKQTYNLTRDFRVE